MTQRLTPVDILNIHFRRRLRGYGVGEVDDFVRRVAADMEILLTESAVLQNRITALEQEVGRFRTLEATLRDAIVLAQQTADETRAAAHRKAEAVVLDAQARAHEIEARMQARIVELYGQAETLRQEKRRIGRDLRAQLTAHLEWLAQEIEREGVSGLSLQSAVDSSATPMVADVAVRSLTHRDEHRDEEVAQALSAGAPAEGS